MSKRADELKAELGKVHLMGVGGVGVSAVARLMLDYGLTVSGSDAKDLPVMDGLRERGARIHVGYAPEHLGDADTVVISSIIKPGNPEYDEAVRRGLRILHRSEGLEATMRGHDRVVAIAGTHGKTTTTSLTAHMLKTVGAAPSFAVGANIPSLGTNAELGNGGYFVAEADESDASFLNYRPDVIIVTNVEADHLDHYGTAEAVHQAFVDFAQLLPEDGLLICCADDPGANELAHKMRQSRGDLRVQTYGFSDHADRRLGDARALDNGRFAATIEWGSGQEHILDLAVPGQHNLLNAAAALSVGIDAGVDVDDALEALAGFSGAARRFEFKGEADGVRVYDDYAHHPTEVTAALKAGRVMAGEGKLHVLFQPHLFSRTKEFYRQFASALSLADTVTLLEIYPAREEPIEGVNSELIAERVEVPAHVFTPEAAVAHVVENAEPGDVIMTVGAGDVTYLGGQLLDALS
ncbi:UDP-N-acetylmuramate--L-alanine ligase [Glutamicibacter protophormiae]|uniref:UDP-N-acetylmuramate--L-alanine ligase n=1 Tax=Glutamicibacter protophormiae TaxID=37930 RepID=A0ABS4XUC8_GLUPR|nr:UDP-N-acetylmuramate--L-alanine ligase [Glutamicibacter protophormiae]MBP2400105.1 UDP-N-acetylmuramate--alanine ligase [Glutamicibacter protophormiae]WPR63417.1 UDP-N-acetylmuramate--L-alanine ligase [Glutamicibacter protophormiae]WPR66913.1 UDP-N-acetylmuramate--L-alanine ligase [Glutamicibacter protophormiae]GGL75184.1 UDP-N-acetylmuramate--L-alanine ligase [Glutamicibacter protophormiae]